MVLMRRERAAGGSTRHAAVSLLLSLLLVLGWAAPLQAQPTPSSASIQIVSTPAARLSAVLSLMRQAKHSIRLEVYLLTNRTVITELGQAHRRGVDVRVLLEEHPFRSGTYATTAYRDLHALGVPVRWANEQAFTYTHAKFMEIDNQLAGIFTFNLSSSGMLSNREFGLIDRYRPDVRALAAIFQADWQRRQARVSDARLAISPVNARRDFRSLIAGAHHTLDLYAEEVADPSIESQLGAKARHGVRVRLITSQPSSGVDTLKRTGVTVWIMPSPYVHAKAIVADGRRLFVGSENISSTSLDRNREVGLVVANRSLANAVEQRFAADWRTRPTPSPPPSGSSHSHGLQVRVAASPASVTRGKLLTIAAATSPGASCSIRVTYPDGYVSRAHTLQETKTAASNGKVSWSWRVGSTVPGTGHAAVTCRLGSSSASASTAFSIAGTAS
jgi:cardiolipin synthase A/B